MVEQTLLQVVPCFAMQMSKFLDFELICIGIRKSPPKCWRPEAISNVLRERLFKRSDHINRIRYSANNDPIRILTLIGTLNERPDVKHWKRRKSKSFSCRLHMRNVPGPVLEITLNVFSRNTSTKLFDQLIHKIIQVDDKSDFPIFIPQ